MFSRGPTLGEQVYAYIRERIVSGHYRPGQMIVEAELAQVLNVSRTPVSNAVITLKERGLIEERNGRFAILSLTLDDVIDLYQCRLAFDGLAAQLAAPRVTAAQLSRLRELLPVWEQPHEEGDLHSHWEADLSFHSLLYEASANRHLIHFSEVATDLLSTYRRAIVEKLTGDAVQAPNPPTIQDEHAQVIAALATGLPELAEQAARAHIQHVIYFLESVRPLVSADDVPSRSQSSRPA
jgi:DNA-binding GntR family transcriptional regulator